MTIGNSSALLGFTNDGNDTSAKHIQGTVAVANGTDYIYALAASTIAAAGTTNLTGAFGATTTTAGTNYTHDVAAPGITIGTYGWFRKVATPF
jgi:hypothetical protein